MSCQAKQGSVFFATLLIMGTCIGTSFLAIPIMIGFAGFFSGVLMSLVIWLFSLLNGFLYAEAALGNPDGSNLFTISRTLLGRIVAYIVSAIFIISMYAYISSYYTAGPLFFSWFSQNFLEFDLSPFPGKVLVALLLAAVVYCGFFFAGRINFLLIFGLIVAFFLTIYYGSEHIILSHFSQFNLIYIPLAIPIIFSSFGYNALIPSICTYLNRDKRKIQLTIFFGTTATLTIYLLWQWIIIGVISNNFLQVAYSEGRQITQSFPQIKNFSLFAHSLNFIIFFAAVTSVICIGLALVDFYSDCAKIPIEKRRGWNRLLICLLTFIPPLFIAAPLGIRLIPKLIDYIIAPIGGIVIDGILPIIMVAKARYYFKLPTPRFIPKQGYILFIMGLGIFFLIYLEGVVLIR